MKEKSYGRMKLNIVFHDTAWEDYQYPCTPEGKSASAWQNVMNYLVQLL